MTDKERLTIDEVIEHCNRHTEIMEKHSGREQLEETPIGNSNIMKQYWEHRQVADWLEELKAYREIGTVEECTEAVLNIEHFYMHGRNKAIDEFAEHIKGVYPFTVLELEQLDDIAEQMKGGAE